MRSPGDAPAGALFVTPTSAPLTEVVKVARLLSGIVSAVEEPALAMLVMAPEIPVEMATTRSKLTAP